MGPIGGLDAVEKRKILHWRESIPDLPTRSPSLYRLSYPNSSNSKRDYSSLEVYSNTNLTGFSL
jgi:hypothetical protein